MVFYAWTIAHTGRQPIARVTTLFDLADVLHALNLPGAPSPEWMNRLSLWRWKAVYAILDIEMG